ncbi:MAG: carboxypeptidase-like regulatory domain-containing protein [Chitinophagaceae bacterium]|nr:carboxypeptidase-like regulatory domain-containing protein [Chitinophagaceae bacterium]
MRKSLLFSLFLLLLHIHVSGQQYIKEARQKSWQSLVYKIPADSADKYIRNWKINIDAYIQQAVFAVWNNAIEHFELLPPGNYIIVAVAENELVAKFYCKSNVGVMPVNDRHRLRFEIRDSIGNAVKQADIWLNNKKLHHDPATQTYISNSRKADEAIIKVAADGDTSFFELAALENYTKTYWNQRWTNLYYKKPVYFASTPVRFVKRMITTEPAYWFRSTRYYRKAERGYVIFNQPKYKPGDTLRLKAYVINRKGRQYKKPLHLQLNYYSNGKYFSRQLTTLSPVSPGAYVYEFVLGDSLDADKTYQLNFQKKKDETVLSGNFKIEDYLLDEVATYSLRSEKESYYQKDTLLFYANAKDANGLALMDGKARIYLIAKNIPGFYQQQVLVPDTLWQQEKPLLVEGDTRFEIPASSLPDADLDIDVTVEFRNSNNEIQEKEASIKLLKNTALIKAVQEDGYITAEYLKNGISIPKKGKLSYGDDDMEREMQFPFKEKINPFTEEYEFWIEDEEGKVTVFEYTAIEKTADVIFSRVQSKDSSGFSLYNPLKANVHYNVLYGNKVMTAGSDTAENIAWIDRLDKKKIYSVVWNYTWAGKEHKGENTIALLSKLLGTTISGAANIYPGKTDTIKINVKDYKGKPASSVNLTAVSYNSQFSKDIKVPEPPYLQRYKRRSRLYMDDYGLEKAGFTSQQLLGNHQQWRSVFGLDSMLYYRFLFPDKGKYTSSKYTGNYIPQLSVFAVQKGVPQEIYLLYINRELVWYNGVTDSSSYAFKVAPGYVQVGFRLKDKYVEIDSIYVQPYYKHDMVFDLDMLPANTKVISRENMYTYVEQRQLEQQLFRISNDGRTNDGYIWQNDRLVKLTQSRSHIVGPFQSTDSLQFFKPGAFDLKFAFEPEYEYTLTPAMARLEKKPLFPQKHRVKLPGIKITKWVLGDTIPSLPVIQYNTVYTPPYLLANDYYYTKSMMTGAVSVQLPPDSSFIYAILYSIDADSNITRIKNYQLTRFESVAPGNYHLVLVTKNLHFLEVENIKVLPNTTTCIKINAPVYQSNNLFVEALHVNQLRKPLMLPSEEPVKDTGYTPVITGLPMPKGNAAIEGVITDKEGKSPIVGAVVLFKGYSMGTSSGMNGHFMLRGTRSGVYTLVISAVGYETKAIQVSLQDNQTIIENIELKQSELALQEVVVVGYGVQKKRSLTGSVSVISGQSLFTALQGKVAGVQITGVPGNASPVIIRGTSALNGDTKLLYVINGVLMDDLPAEIEMDKVQMSVLKGEMATNLYGARAANGVIVITTSGFAPKTLRENFKDYAIWQPNLITDKDGNAQFVATYPDNITSWQTFVVGMDKKKRITKTSTIVKSFKPMLAQLAAPQFLIEGDSATAIGKLINYTTDPVTIKSAFSINDSTIYTADQQLRAKEALSERLLITGKGDTVKAQYSLRQQNGYADGELRKIPVYKKGTEEAKGIFSILQADTGFVFTPDPNAGKTVLYIQDNPLDVLLDELKYLKDYPYFCMEQTASKLTGLLLEKQIRKTLRQPFKEDKQVQQLLSKLQKAQLFNGGWGWWKGDEANLYITNYITRALLPLKEDALVQTNLRNATLYLQNVLPRLQKGELLDALYTLSEADHIMDYSAYLQKIGFDSLTVHQQWLVIAVKQKQQMSYTRELNTVMSKKIETMLGGIHWGEDSYWWQSNEVATTVLAYTILQRKQGQQDDLRKIIQYFLERRKGGRWRNTVESARICAAILPMVLQQQPNYASKPVVTITGAEKTTIDKFPYITTVSDQSAPFEITKKGGGMMYVTAWQKIFNADPLPVTNNFVLTTRFEKNGSQIASLQAGEKATMKVTVNVLKDAEYVLIEIPVPAGCTYADKPQSWNGHKEFLKDKLVIFVEQMPKGEYEYDIELEPRYSGKYHLNPAKAELMYFATFYGRNEMKVVEITP